MLVSLSAVGDEVDATGGAVLTFCLGKTSTASVRGGEGPCAGRVSCRCSVLTTCASFSAMRAGQVGSRGECLRCLGVSANIELRSKAGSAFCICLAEAVHLVVSLPCRSHLSAV